MYGGAVNVPYCDMADPKNKEAAQELLARVELEEPRYPLVFIDGTLMIAGSAHFHQVLRAVQEVLGPVPVTPQG